MFVDSTLLLDVKKVLGSCETPEMYRRLSDAVRLGSNQSKSNDWNIGEMDICVCDCCVTLPADVMTVLAVNSGGSPTLIRDQWFQYHINGSGSGCCAPCGYTDEVGQVVTYKDPSGPVLLVAVVENALDSGKAVRVYGWDENGKRIYTEGAGGLLEDGFLVPTTFGFSNTNPDAPAITRIDRIKKDLTNGFIRLVAIDPDDATVHTQIGYYMPWETTPTYRRIKVQEKSWVRIKYKRRDIEVRGTGDWINIDNREALLLLLRAVKYRMDGRLEDARNYELEGMRLLSNEAEALRPNAISPPQVIFTDHQAQVDSLYY